MFKEKIANRSSIKLEDSELLDLRIWAKLLVIAEGRSYYLTMILFTKLSLEKKVHHHNRSSLLPRMIVMHNT